MTKSKTETEVSNVTEEVKKDSRASETREATKARQKFYSDKAKERDDAVHNDLLKDQHPSMPISNDSRSSKSFGGK
jgi:hypothetical protein